MKFRMDATLQFWVDCWYQAVRYRTSIAATTKAARGNCQMEILASSSVGSRSA